MKRTSSLESDGWSRKAPETLSYKGSIRILLDVYRLKVMRTQDRERENVVLEREREQRLLAVCREREESWRCFFKYISSVRQRKREKEKK